MLRCCDALLWRCACGGSLRVLRFVRGGLRVLWCVRGSPVHAGVCKIASACHGSTTSFGGHVPLDADARPEYLRPMVDLRLMSDHVSSEP